MKFHLDPPEIDLPERISYSHLLMSIGSCFSENIGQELKRHFFDIRINPTGILFHPLAISRNLRMILVQKTLTKNELVSAQGVWHSYDFHGSLGDSNIDRAIEQMNHALEDSFAYLLAGDWLLVTFGTAVGYRLADSGKMVANCHKQPAAFFTKEMSSTQEILEEWSSLILELKEKNPRLKILFSVSPVRYIREGIVENNRSKARLLESVHLLCEQFDNCYYFPAYELVNDVLRDHRFFKADLVHPNSQAVDYVLDYFCHSMLTPPDRTLWDRIHGLVLELEHRPLFPNSETTQHFGEKLKGKLQQLQSEFPFLKINKV